jgi:drug/metabolite transporter (DMT)-like permease
VRRDQAAGQGRDRRAVLLAVLGAGSLSASAILIKLAATSATEAALLRCLLALPLLAAIAAVERRRLGPRPAVERRPGPRPAVERRCPGLPPAVEQRCPGLPPAVERRRPGRRPAAARRRALLAGLFLAVDLVLWNHAIADVGAGVATVLGNLQVLFVALVAWLALRERPERRALLMIPVVMLGVVLVSGLVGTAVAGAHPLAGIGYGLGTSIAYTGFLLILRQAAAGTPHVAGPLADATAGSVAGCLVLGLVFGGLRADLPWPSLGWLALLALTSQTVGWLLVTSSLPRLPAAVSSLLLLLQPAASLLLAAIVLGERPGLLQLAGAALVCTGVASASGAVPGRAAARPGR